MCVCLSVCLCVCVRVCVCLFLSLTLPRTTGPLTFSWCDSRAVTVEFDSFFLVALYVPNSGVMTCVCACVCVRACVCVCVCVTRGCLEEAVRCCVLCTQHTHTILPCLMLLLLLSGIKLERLDYRINEWNKDLLAYVKKLEERKPVVVTGDLNVAHLDEDEVGTLPDVNGRGREGRQ